jgi:cyclophilin family peptidyl-prolyl cis-trans isomerase
MSVSRRLLILVAILALPTSAMAAGKKKKATPKKDGPPVVEVVTSLGSFKVELWPDKAPKTVANFLGYVDSKFYDGTIFHRVIPGFMIQGGGFDEKLTRKETKAPIVNESKPGLSNVKGSIAMARTSDLDSATAQFFVNTVDNSSKLDAPKYCVFGKVIDGMDVVLKIEKVQTGSQNGMGDVPVTPVVIKSIRKL